MLEINEKQKSGFLETGIEIDTIFKDLPGHYGKPHGKHTEKEAQTTTARFCPTRR
jgi:hypothetical protein